MSGSREALVELLADQPSLEDQLRSILEIDQQNSTWTFEDIPVDSGVFGELVSRGIIEQAGDEYRIADPDAVEAVVNGDVSKEESSISPSFSVSLLDRVRTVDRLFVMSVLGAFALVFLMRTVFSWEAVFRGEYIFLSGNDPYYYRYVVEEQVRDGGMIGNQSDGEVLLVAVLSYLASLAGGESTVGIILAWYPVVAAVITGAFIYSTSAFVFADRRIAVASVIVYAVTPIIAYRSAVGFGDHHAFDYLLIAAVIAGLTATVAETAPWRKITPQRVIGVAVLGIGTAGLVHAWRGGVLLALPLGIFFLLSTVSALRSDQQPIHAHIWVLGAVVLASLVAAGPHLLWDWTRGYRAYTPAALLVLAVVFVVTAEVAGQFEISPTIAGGLEVAMGLGTSVAAWITFPTVKRVVEDGMRFITETNQSTITETASLFAAESGVITTPIFYFGFAFFFGLAALLWAIWRSARNHQPALLALVVFTSAFFFASTIQVRFAGHLAIVLAIFSGLAFVYLLAIVDATPTPSLLAESETKSKPASTRHPSVSTLFSLPDRDEAFAMVAIFLLVGGLGIAQTAGGASDMTIDNSTADAAVAIDRHAASANISWPDNYVLSEWSWNRVYNYFVNGQSRSYGYARTNYADFVTGENATKWYKELQQKPVGYVVMQNGVRSPSANSMQTRLWQYWGGATPTANGSGHYRAIYADSNQKVFSLVPGALLVGHASPNTSVTVSTDFTVGGSTHQYVREPTTTANGWYAIRVPYNGTYHAGDEPISVSQEAVTSGSLANPQSTAAYWPLNASRGDIAFDILGGNHGHIVGADWATNGSGLSFAERGRVTVPDGDILDSHSEFTLSATFQTRADTNYTSNIRYPRIVTTATRSSFRNTSGVQLALARGNIIAAAGDGSNATILRGPRVDDAEVHTASLVREEGLLRLEVDNETVDSASYTGRIEPTDTVSIGATSSGRVGFVGRIRSVKYVPEVSDRKDTRVS